MRVPLSWLLAAAGVDPSADPAEVARRLTAAGLEVESVQQVGHDIDGIVVAEVTAIEELTGFKKPVRYCQVRTGAADDARRQRGVICGAVNFAAGDRVPLALPGAQLPGGFQITARKTYGHVSDGMICSAAELGIGDDHSGILVLPPDAPLGADFVAYAGLADDVLDIAVTPDRGYALSVRGVARELATSYGLGFGDLAHDGLPDGGLAADSARSPPRCTRPASRTRPRATGSCSARSAGSTRRAHPAADAGPAGPGRDAVGVARRGHHQLPDAGAGPAAARVRRGQAERPDRGAPGPAGGAAGDPRPRGPRARPGGHRHRRRLRGHLAGRHHGRGWRPRSPGPRPTSSSRPRTSTPAGWPG